jgi:hypothetical protein
MYQTGEYPVRVLVICNVDSVVAKLNRSLFAELSNGKRWGIVHLWSLARPKGEKLSDSDKVRKMIEEGYEMITTCWNAERARFAVFQTGISDVRTYSIMERQDVPLKKKDYNN